MKHILKCKSCGSFTMNETCTCGSETITTKPPRYSPHKYAEYRRKARREILEEEGLL